MSRLARPEARTEESSRLRNRGDRLAEAMRHSEWQKQAALAKALGVAASTVYRWRVDGVFSLDHAIAICDLLDISLDWLLLGRGGMNDRRASRFSDPGNPSGTVRRTMESTEIEARRALAAIEAALPSIFDRPSR